MANIKITELNEISTIDNDDVLPIVDSSANETKKVTKGDLVNDVYSTSEVKTNKVWVDNKPIYRKVIYVNGFTAPTYDSSTDTITPGIKTIQTNITNLDYLVNMYGSYWEDNTGTQAPGMFPLNFNAISTITNSIPALNSSRVWWTYFSGDDLSGNYSTIKIYNFSGRYASQMKGYITLEYTKTT